MGRLVQEGVRWKIGSPISWLISGEWALFRDINPNGGISANTQKYESLSSGWADGEIDMLLLIQCCISSLCETTRSN